MQLVQNRVSFLSAGKEKQFYDYFFFFYVGLHRHRNTHAFPTSMIFTTA